MDAGLSSGVPKQFGFSKVSVSSEWRHKGREETRGECRRTARRFRVVANGPSRPPLACLRSGDTGEGKSSTRTRSRRVPKDRNGCTGGERLVVHHVRSCLTVLPSPGAIYSSETVTCRACNSAIFEYRHGKWIRCKNHIPLVSSILFLGSCILSNGPRFAVPHALGECQT